MEHEGHRERLRERFLSEELNGFAPHEMLELLLTYAIPRRDTNPIAHRLLDHFGSLHATLEAPVEELQQVEGIGPGAAVLIRSLLPLYRAYEQDKLVKKLSLSTFSAVKEYCVSLFKGVNDEKFYVLCFDAKLNLIQAPLIAEGTVSEVHAHPRLILSALLRNNASSAVLTHNHPGGALYPSEEDRQLTETIRALLDGVGITLHDHLIVSGQNTFSFFENRML